MDSCMGLHKQCLCHKQPMTFEGFWACVTQQWTCQCINLVAHNFFVSLHMELSGQGTKVVFSMPTWPLGPSLAIHHLKFFKWHVASDIWCKAALISTASALGFFEDAHGKVDCFSDVTAHQLRPWVFWLCTSTINLCDDNVTSVFCWLLCPCLSCGQGLLFCIAHCS